MEGWKARSESESEGQHETEELVRLCRQGDQMAWSRLVERYKNLVFAIIRRSQSAPGEENDLFQAVWIDVFTQLGQLRAPASLKSWIATLTRHKCYHWRQRALRRVAHSWDYRRAASLEDPAPPIDKILAELDRQQEVREVVQALSPRCRELLEMLFLTDPPVPYAEAAERLGLAVGSIGWMRSSCLERLRREARDRGLS